MGEPEIDKEPLTQEIVAGLGFTVMVDEVKPSTNAGFPQGSLPLSVHGCNDENVVSSLNKLG